MVKDKNIFGNHRNNAGWQGIPQDGNRNCKGRWVNRVKGVIWRTMNCLFNILFKKNEREEEAIWSTCNKISLTWVIGTWMFYYSLWFAECSCGRPEFNPWVQKMPWRREWQPTPVFLPGESHGMWSLVGFSPWGHQESDTTERLTLSLSLWYFNGFKMLWYENLNYPNKQWKSIFQHLSVW